MLVRFQLGAQIMYRILLFSDIHYSTNSLHEEKRWYPGVVSLLDIFSKRAGQRFLNFCDRHTHRHFKTFSDAMEGRNFDAAVCLGDMTPGTKEMGLISEKARAEAIELKERLRHMFDCPLYFVLGNHDVGYVAPIGYKNGGMSQKSLQSALEIYNIDPFYTFRLNGYKFIVLTSALIDSGNAFEEAAENQLRFLKAELEYDGKIFLLIHSPFVFFNQKLRAIIHASKNIEAIICGDVHHRLIGHVVNWFLPIHQKVLFISSIIGFFGTGRGFAELTLDRSYRIRYSRL
jgi:predicted phosphodiesterase